MTNQHRENGKIGAQVSQRKYLASDARQVNEQKKAVVRKMRLEGYTIQDIADHFGVKYGTMRRYCTKHGIKANPTGEQE